MPVRLHSSNRLAHRFVSALALVAAAGIQPGQAQASDEPDLTVSGSIRLRYEALDGQFRPGRPDSDDILAIRTTLAAEYDTGPVRIGGELIDARVYGDAPASPIGTAHVNAFELVQAYIGFDFGRAKLDVGRFTMDMGSRRLVSRSNFRNTTNAFAGAKLRVTAPGGIDVLGFYTLPLQRLPDDPEGLANNRVQWDRESFDLALWGGNASIPLAQDGLRLDGYALRLNERDSAGRATRDRKLTTLGLHLLQHPRPGRVDYDLEAAYQTGSISAGAAPDAATLDVDAHMLHAAVGYTFASDWQPRLSFAFDLASGDGEGDDYGRFDTLYGARRFEFGPTGIFGLLGRANIRSPGVRLEAKPAKGLDWFAMYRAAWLDSVSDSFASSGVRDPSGASGSFAGHQLEMRLRYWIVPGVVQADLGGALWHNGAFMRDAPSANGHGDAAFGYLGLTARFD